MKVQIKLTVLLFYFTTVYFSQNFSTRLFSKDQGLTDAYVYSVIQDTEGFLWMSTGKGLTRFDGQVFSSTDIGLPAEDLVYAACKGKNGSLWFGTSTGKLISVNSRNKHADIFSKSCKASINKIVVSSFSENIFINTIGNGIFIKRGNELSQLKGTEEYQINALEELSQDLLLAGTSEGLFSVNTKNQQITKIQGLEGEIKGIQKLKIRKNTFIVCTAKSDFYEIEIISTTELKIKPLVLSENSGEVKTFLFNEEDQTLFIAGSDERLSAINTVTKKKYAFPETEFAATAYFFYQDEEKNTWISTTGKGLYRISKNSYSLLEMGEPVFAICEDSSRKYFGTKDGVIVEEKNNSAQKRISKIQNKVLGKVNALYYDSRFLWIGTETRGLLVVNPENLETLRLEFSGIENLSVNSITGNTEDVLVTTNLDGVYNFERYILRNHFSVQNSLLHNNVYYSLLNKKSKIFYATHNTSFNYSEGKQLYEIDTKDLGLISDFNSFAENKRSELYIGTNGDGVYILKDAIMHPFEFNEELDSKFCEGLVFDQEDNLWIEQRYHLYKYYSAEKVLSEIKLPQNQQILFNPNAFYSTKNEMYFGTNKGVLLFNPSGNKDKLALPYLINVRIRDSLIKDNISKKLSSGVYNIAFEFSALALKNSEDVRFKYKLEGRDEHWSEWSDLRKVEFSKLGEGEYTFKVVARNSAGFLGEETTLYHFNIAAPFWKSPLFWIALLVLLILVVYMIIKLRTAKLIEAKNKLEESVAEKTKQLREEKEIVEKSNVRIEEQSQEIRDSITYAKRIQDALLPEKKILSDYHENLFVLYQPRDIVSGDFYWMADLGHLKFIAVADCTGHGVPGALMSMIGTTLLNKVILERKITRPKDILKALDKEIKQALKQHTEDATRDGMDICFCCVDTNSRKLIYAGAMRPLYFVRDRQLSEYNPTKHAIGGFSYGKEKEFEETEIDLQKGDMFYLFSDGYADQFGGELGKKLMLKNFKKILISISDMELVKQEENLHRVYNNWKGNLDQVDDVLVIGIKI